MRYDPIVKLPPLVRHTGPVAMDAISWELQPMDVTEEFRRITLGGHGLVISVNDTGADFDHPDLEGCDIIGSKSFVRSRFGAKDQDGHGTFVLSQIYRLLPNAKYLVAKVLGDDGRGLSSGILAGDEWAAENGAMIINESLGSNQPFQPKKDWLRTWDGLLFAAAGNTGREGIGYPANYGIEVGVIPCGSYGPDDDRSPFSTWGARLLCLGAGEQITAARAGGGRRVMSGSSMGTPDAAATFGGYLTGLWAAGHGDVTAPEAIDALVSSIAHDMESPGRDRQTGYGRLTRENVIKQLKKLDGGVL